MKGRSAAKREKINKRKLAIASIVCAILVFIFSQSTLEFSAEVFGRTLYKDSLQLIYLFVLLIELPVCIYSSSPFSSWKLEIIENAALPYLSVLLLYTLSISVLLFWISLAVCTIVILGCLILYSTNWTRTNSANKRHSHVKNLMNKAKGVACAALASVFFVTAVVSGTQSNSFKQYNADELQRWYDYSSYLKDDMELAKLEASIWGKLSYRERENLMKYISKKEATEYLGIPPITIVFSKGDDKTLGRYNEITDTIWIDSQQLELDTPEEALNTLFHELFHAFQARAIETINWDNELFQQSNISWFRHMKMWEYESRYPVSAEENFSVYYNSDTERTARSYAEKTVEAYLLQAEAISSK